MTSLTFVFFLEVLLFFDEDFLLAFFAAAFFSEALFVAELFVEEELEELLAELLSEELSEELAEELDEALSFFLEELLSESFVSFADDELALLSLELSDALAVELLCDELVDADDVALCVDDESAEFDELHATSGVKANTTASASAAVKILFVILSSSP
ncbi:MAG: hypothetical protein ACOX69_09075 [Coriobacteriales bacterium]